MSRSLCFPRPPCQICHFLIELLLPDKNFGEKWIRLNGQRGNLLWTVFRSKGVSCPVCRLFFPRGTSWELLSAYDRPDEPTGEEVHRADCSERKGRQSARDAVFFERCRLGRRTNSFPISQHGIRRSRESRMVMIDCKNIEKAKCTIFSVPIWAVTCQQAFGLTFHTCEDSIFSEVKGDAPVKGRKVLFFVIPVKPESGIVNMFWMQDRSCPAPDTGFGITISKLSSYLNLMNL